MNRRLTIEQKELVRANVPMAKAIARSVVHRRRAQGSLPLALSTALEALIEAALTYDPTRGTPFDQYAWRRIEGEVTDMIRHENRIQSMFCSGARETTELVDDPGTELTDSPDEATGHLDGMADEVMAGGLLRAVGVAKSGVSVRASYASVIKLVDDLVAKARPEQRQVVELYDWQGLSFEKVAEQLGISPSTAKRRHKEIRCQIVKALRAQKQLRAHLPHAQL